jgi:signal transduction histidine kinase/tetratricopeptide (TPR) repeat protein
MRKKISISLFGLIVSFSFLNAQVKPADSLSNLLVSHTQEDTGRVNLLNNLAYELRRTKPGTADSLITLAISLADNLNYPKGKGYALSIEGARYYAKLKYKEADSVFALSKQLLENVKDDKDLAYMFRTWASMKMDEGNHAQSLDYFLQGLKKAQEAGDIKQAVDIERTIGYLYNILGEYEKAIPYQTDALKQAESINYKVGMSGAYNAIGKTYKTQGNYPASLEAYTKGLDIDRELKDSSGISIDHGNIGDVYERMGNYPKAFENIAVYLDFLKDKPGLEDRKSWGEWLKGKAYTHSGDPAKGLSTAKHALELANKVGWRLYLREITALIAESAAKLKQWDIAYQYQVLSSNYKDSLTGKEIAQKTAMLQASLELDKKQAQIALLTKDKQLQLAENKREKAFLFATLGGLAALIVVAIMMYRNNKQKQRANILLEKQKKEIDIKAGELAVQKDNLEQSYRNVELLGEVGRKITSSLSVETIIATVYDNVNALMDASVFGIGIYHEDTKRIDFPATYENGVALPSYSNSIYEENRFASLCFISGKEIVMGDLETEYKNFLQDVLVPKQGQQPVSLIYLPLKIKDKMMGVITVQSFHKNAYSEYQLYMLRNIAIYAAIALDNAESYKKLNQTVESLKKTQTQLIQSEKMASLGELTAGIAHEIQNPLNFVNNFSEVNTELIDELQEEANNGNLELVRSIAKDIKDNEQKIVHHGKRADAIVKSMLQHSRSSAGKKEPTDINSLADEYLRLAYHGLRARDKSFTANFKTNFDTHIDKINLIPQDIGRVLVNLINNAFYAVAEKQKHVSTSSTRNGYEPTVTVTTKKMDGKIELKISDNGNGISQKVMDKIFQPFFTTKPTGQGTGLGLSLSYDIITKGHNGELKVETKEGEYSEFIIVLPV